MDSGEWEAKYDKAVSSLVRETLTISEVFFLESPQRATLRRLIRKSIYGIMDGLKEDLQNDFEVSDARL
jgi:hypothetical protein